jgi:hypothetical protein
MDIAAHGEEAYIHDGGISPVELGRKSGSGSPVMSPARADI